MYKFHENLFEQPPETETFYFFLKPLILLQS